MFGEQGVLLKEKTMHIGHMICRGIHVDKHANDIKRVQWSYQIFFRKFDSSMTQFCSFKLKLVITLFLYI